MLSTLLQVALGGAFGASLRYLSGMAIMRLAGHGFPWGTMFVNIVGSFTMGVVAVLLNEIGANRFIPLAMTGVLGGFTTFSAFSLDTVSLWERGEFTFAAAYVLGSVVLSISALLAGMALVRSLT